MNEQKIKPGILILHFFILLIFFVTPAGVAYSLGEPLAPEWTDSTTWGEYDTGEYWLGVGIAAVIYYIVLFLLSIPVFLLWALWFKSIYNHTVPIIYNIRKITYWESFGLSVLISFFIFVLGTGSWQ